MGPTLTYRTLFARVLAVVIVVVGAAALVFFLLDGGVRELARSGPVVLFVVAGVWALFWEPYVEVSDGGVTIANVVRTVHVPWPTLTGVDSQWALRVHASGRTYSSWAVPASSGMGSRVQGTRGRDEERRSALTRGNNADAAALAIGERLKALQDAGHLGGATIGAVHPTVTWNTRVLVVLGVLAVAAATGLLLG